MVVGILAAAISWVAGPSRGLLNVGRQRFLPPSLQTANAAGVQALILLVQGAIVTVLALAFVVIPCVSSAFWVLQAMTVMLYLTMYIMLFIAAWRLRRIRPDAPRSFKVPAIGLFATMGTVAAIAAILIALVPPAQFGGGSGLHYREIRHSIVGCSSSVLAFSAFLAR